MDLETTLVPADRHAALDPRAVKDAGLVLCDLDGCLVSEGRPFADTAAFVAACGSRLWIVSNASGSTAAALSLRLSEMGLTVPAARILLAGEITLGHLYEVEQIRRLRLYAAPALADAARALGIDTGSDRPEAVLICRDAGVTVDTMGPILSDIGLGARLWIANEDLSHPAHDGQPVAETGALLAALRAIRPELQWRSLGKPDPTMLQIALARTGTAPEHAVFVGDNAATDGRAAAAAGVPFLHIQRRPGR
ncbi:HAD-IA family hydrolase [Oceanicola sp. 22II-s10i]|uniref:HAD-IA family hydrolase n=1 Tax=Oceanicola sp. 22II-s10i TaxID=1317116 RepID=UPI00159593B9|nr:HAD-IA family hydrolase [Oceanicola sp. 22II-s10i]